MASRKRTTRKSTRRSARRSPKAGDLRCPAGKTLKSFKTKTGVQQFCASSRRSTRKSRR